MLTEAARQAAECMQQWLAGFTTMGDAAKATA